MTNGSLKLGLTINCVKLTAYTMNQCTARAKTCRKCGYRFTKDERELWECPQCGENRRCKRHAVSGYSVCQVHGAGSPLQGRPGGTPVRKAGGRYSKRLPSRLLEKYEEAINDDELLSTRDDIAVVDARITDLLLRVDTGEASKHWFAASSALNDLTKAIRKSDTEGMASSINELKYNIGKGVSDYAAWNDVTSLIDQRRRLVESERKRLLEMQQYITVERINILIGAILHIIYGNVKDRNAIAGIEAGIRKLISAETD